MTGSYTLGRKALLLALAPDLNATLGDVLRRCGCEVYDSSPLKEIPRADIVFCGGDPPTIHRARACAPDVPIVAVTTGEDPRSCLDALDAGAADYCSQPFLFNQIEWLLELHAPPRKAFAAA